MSNMYCIYNKLLCTCLSQIDSNGNSHHFVGTYEEMSSVLESVKDKAELEIISVEEFMKRQNELINNENFLKASDDLAKKIYNELHEALEGTDVGEQIKYDIAIRDRNINGFPSTTLFNNNDMTVKLWEKLDNYHEALVDSKAFNYDDLLLNDLGDNIRLIKRAWHYYFDGKITRASKEIETILTKYVNDPFIVSSLDKSYALRQMACFDELNYNSLDAGSISEMASKKYEAIKDHSLTLYRGRKCDHQLKSRKEMVHRPYVRNEKIERQRFTCAGIPALYLCSTSYGCWLECGRPEKDFYVSCFTPKDNGLKLKVLNLLDNQYLINGLSDYGHEEHIDLQRKLISLLPLTLATSFKYADGKNEEQYIIPELVMRALENVDIDGIAYISKNLDSDLQFQIGINIAFPVYKKHLIDGGFGNICRCFDMTEPVLFDKSSVYTDNEAGSYIYDIYFKEQNMFEYKPSVNKSDGGEEYGKTRFAEFDNYLANQEMKCAF